MNQTEIVEKLLRELKQEINRKSELVAAGACSDFDSYIRLTTEIKVLGQVRAQLVDFIGEVD